MYTYRFVQPVSFTVLLLVLLTGVGGLRDVKLVVPTVVPPGGSATFICSYNLEGEPLYTVKWYKGREEFFRYVPKEHPHTRVFPLPGVNVDISASGPEKVVLRDIQSDMAGKYRCEVSTDAPDFHTEVVSEQMHVISLLEADPKITLQKTSYSVGDTLRGNCSSPASRPPPNVTWYINDKKMNASYTVRDRGDAYGSTTAGLRLEVNTFLGGKLKITCVADVYGIYATKADVWLDEDRPRLASVLGTRGSSGSKRSLQIYSNVSIVIIVSFLLLRLISR